MYKGYLYVWERFITDLKVLKFEDRPQEQKIVVHWVFGVKISLKSRNIFLESRYLIDPPHAVTHSSVLWKDAMRILLTVEYLHYPSVILFNIKNMKLNSDIYEKVYFILRDRFGSKSIWVASRYL